MVNSHSTSGSDEETVQVHREVAESEHSRASSPSLRPLCTPPHPAHTTKAPSEREQKIFSPPTHPEPADTQRRQKAVRTPESEDARNTSGRTSCSKSAEEESDLTQPRRHHTGFVPPSSRTNPSTRPPGAGNLHKDTAACTLHISACHRHFPDTPCILAQFAL
jgi:FtsZ-interacting cell division protein ZipA